jgi:crossover junction endodeoxyribonuclease RusA
MNAIEFFVPGVPATAGSKRAFYNKHTGKAMIVDTCNNKPWRGTVQVFAQQAYSGPLLDGPLRVSLEFQMPRPKGHYRTGKRSNELKDNAPKYHTSKPDVLKMARLVEDALTGVIWKDDSLICVECLSKEYSEEPGVTIRISEQES